MTYLKTNTDGDGVFNNVIYVKQRKTGDYKLQIIPGKGAKSNDTYSVEISAIENEFGWVPILKSDNVTISAISAQPVTFSSQKRESTYLVCSGNSDNIVAGSILLRAVLADAAGKPLAGKEIVYEIGDQTVTAITNSEGIAVSSMEFSKDLEKYKISARFTGDEKYLPSGGSTPAKKLK